MKKGFLYLLLAASVATTQMTACKGKKTDTTQTTTSTIDTTPATAPVEIATDNELSNGVRDATKDYPGVTATVNNGEVTLNGTIKRDRLPRLMESIHALHPKKVNNNLTVQP